MKQLLFLIAVGFTAVVVAAVPEKNDNAQLLSQIAGYRNWTAVNSKPIEIDMRMSSEAPV